MLRESVTYVIARNETWTGAAATEPVEAGWATEAVFFVRALADPLADPEGRLPRIRAQISPDGMRWIDEGACAAMPTSVDDLQALRVRHFGNWLRLKADLPDGARCTVLVTVHLK
jgi:hypothetical protein